MLSAPTVSGCSAVQSSLNQRQFQPSLSFHLITFGIQLHFYSQRQLPPITYRHFLLRPAGNDIVRRVHAAISLSVNVHAAFDIFHLNGLNNCKLTRRTQASTASRTSGYSAGFKRLESIHHLQIYYSLRAGHLFQTLQFKKKRIM